MPMQQHMYDTDSQNLFVFHGRPSEARGLIGGECVSGMTGSKYKSAFVYIKGGEFTTVNVTCQTHAVTALN